METSLPKYKTSNFTPLNFNLKKIIFSFLPPCDQRNIYWSNKSLRNLLPDSPLMINIVCFKKRGEYIIDRYINGVLELDDCKFAILTGKSIEEIKYNNNNFEFIKSHTIKDDHNMYPCLMPISQNNHIVFANGGNELRICDKDLNLLQSINESLYISSLCNIYSSSSFAVGFEKGSVKIYSRNENTQKYELEREFKDHSDTNYCLLYMPKHDLLLCGSDKALIYVYELSKEGKHIDKLPVDNFFVSSLISLSDDKFASGHVSLQKSNSEIIIWQLKNLEKRFECIKTITYEYYGYIFLNIIGNELLISSIEFSQEFKIWDLKTYECLKTYEEDEIEYNGIMVTKTNNILTSTQDKKINLWNIKY